MRNEICRKKLTDNLSLEIQSRQDGSVSPFMKNYFQFSTGYKQSKTLQH